MSQQSVIDQSRSQFEAWYKGGVIGWQLRFHHQNESKHSPYSFSCTESSWQAWQASREAIKQDGQP